MKKFYDNFIEDKPLPEWASGKKINNWFFYSGKSMNPTFKEGDIIYTKSETKVVPGDIIVFREKNIHAITVHRVICLNKEGFVTRGDNNSFFDRAPVAYEQILGIAELFDNGSQIKVVPNGDRSLKKIKIKWKIQSLSKVLKYPYRLFYRAIKKTRIMHFLLGNWFEKKVTIISLENAAGPLIKMTYKGKTIAMKWSAKGLYASKKPFELLIDESKLLN
jgi:signal peptidase I